MFLDVIDLEDSDSEGQSFMNINVNKTYPNLSLQVFIMYY